MAVSPLRPNLPPLVLASRSPRRQSLLRAIGVPFTVRVSGVEESEHQQGTPHEQALRTAVAKAACIADDSPDGALVLAADTMVVLDGEVFNKPDEPAHARAMLRRLSGRTHTVLTALALWRVGGRELGEVVAADVLFHELSDDLIDRYVASGEPEDKAGSYGIQGLGARLVASVNGDVTGVIGLPLLRLRDYYRELTGADLLDGRSPRVLALAAFPELATLPASCLTGLGE